MTVKVSPSRSVSLKTRFTVEVNGISSITVIASSTATGGSLLMTVPEVGPAVEVEVEVEVKPTGMNALSSSRAG
jgi:hypothetical protein